MNRLIIVGNDKIGRKFINSIDTNKYKIVLDKSSSLKRIFKLIKRGSLRLPLIMKMFISDIQRKDYNIRNVYDSIYTNNDLIEIIKKNNIDEVVLFRGGLIVNKSVLNLNIKILNIHCAKIPEYGGIGVIERALNDKSYNQEATLHIITEYIDKGEILSTYKYQLLADKSYLENENIAYDAGIELFKNYFTSNLKGN